MLVRLRAEPRELARDGAFRARPRGGGCKEKMVGPASIRTEGGEAARGNDFVLVGDDGRAELATAWVRSCGGLQAAKLRQRVMRSERSVSSL